MYIVVRWRMGNGVGIRRVWGMQRLRNCNLYLTLAGVAFSILVALLA